MKVLPYEKQYFSQHGEDGILEFLLKYVDKDFLNFLEIGWGNGNINCCRNLIERHSFKGTGVDINKSLFKHKNFTSVSAKITVDDINFLLSLEGPTPTVFSLDIDSIDWHILNGLINEGFRPKIICHEYNSTLGPDKIIIRSKDKSTKYDKKTLYGASLQAFKYILNSHYNFVTVNSTGVNAFWLRKDFIIQEPYDKHEFLFFKDHGINHESKLKKILSTDAYWEII
jgi:hypothetical protein